MSHSRKIALFGGTFDPVHLGHLFMAGLAKDQLGLDEVRFLPCRISPHKTGFAPAPAEHRLEMLRLATSGLPWAVVDDFELHQPEPSFSHETAEAMATRFPGDQLYWIMGGDQWRALPRWKKPERLAELVEFIVIPRGDPPEPRDGYKLHTLGGEHPASSTLIRKAISEGEAAPLWLADAVSEWIRQKRLYLG